MNANNKQAVILMGHGSRVPGAANGMEKVAQALTQSGAYHMVETCYMSRLGPHFPETVEKCVTGGAKVVSLIPYFLHMGLHTRLDIPEMMKTEAARYPGVKIIFGECIGFDELMIEIVKKRVEASWKLADVRDMVLEPREKFPLPPGDLEFVPMTPEMAEKFREGGRCGHDHHH